MKRQSIIVSLSLLNILSAVAPFYRSVNCSRLYSFRSVSFGERRGLYAGFYALTALSALWYYCNSKLRYVASWYSLNEELFHGTGLQRIRGGGGELVDKLSSFRCKTSFECCPRYATVLPLASSGCSSFCQLLSLQHN